MPGPLRWNTYVDFSGGWFDDPNPTNLPPNALTSALNTIVTGGGAVVRRGGCGPSVFSYTPVPLAIGSIKSLNVDGASGIAVASWNSGSSVVDLHTIDPAVPNAINAMTGTGATTLGSTVGIPFAHRDLLIFPNHGGQTWGLYYGGYAGSQAGAGASSARTITAGSDTITGFSGAETGAFAPGMIFYGTDASSNVYIYRVTAVGASTITVSPTPTIGATTATWQVRSHAPTTGIGSPHMLRGAKTACSFQNRIVAGNVTVRQSGASSDSYHPNRLVWSNLPTETIATYTTDGLASQLTGNAFGAYNFVDVQNTGAIQAVVPIGQGVLAILGREAVNLLVGNLETISATAGGIGFSIQEIGTNAGCFGPQTVQRIQGGVVWAGPAGVFVFDGSKITNISEGRIGKAYRTYIAESTIYGSALIRGEGADYYLLSTSMGALCVNLLNGAWSYFNTGDDIQWTSCTFLIGGSCPDPTYPARTWGIAAGTSVGASTAKVLRLEPMVNPAGTQYGEAFGPLFDFTAQAITRPLVEGNPSQIKRFRHLKVTMIVTASGSVGTITAFSWGRGGTSVGTSDAEAWTLSGYSATNPARSDRFDMQILARGISVAISFAGTNMRLASLEVGSNALNPARA